MSVVAIVNRKGGVGKTTLTVALADFLTALHNKRILLIDLDAQGNLTIACVGDDRWQELERARWTVADVFDDVVHGRSPFVHKEPVSRIHRARAISLIPGTPRLADVEAEALEGDQRWKKRIEPNRILQSALQRHTEAYDYTLVDCPPSLTLSSYNGLALADGYLIPVMPSHVAVYGIEQIGARIDAFSMQIGRKLKRYGTIVNRVDTRTNSHAAVIAELERNPDAAPVWKTKVRASVRAEEGWRNPDSLTLSQRWGTLYGDLEALAQEFVRRVP